MRPKNEAIFCRFFYSSTWFFENLVKLYVSLLKCKKLSPTYRVFFQKATTWSAIDKTNHANLVVLVYLKKQLKLTTKSSAVCWFITCECFTKHLIFKSRCFFLQLANKLLKFNTHTVYSSEVLGIYSLLVIYSCWFIVCVYLTKPP